ncbi:MAG: hypothetical protein OXI37_07710 [Gammaproteobacteria bacterium]|nr:hypothetical protein [Gammaproteobacteria bacterium]
MPEIASWIGTTAVVVIAVIWAILKIVLPKMLDVVKTNIKHAQNQEIARLEASFRLHTEMLKTSVELGHRSGENLRNRRIKATSKMWKEVIRIKREFAGLVALETILTEKEMTESIQAGESGNEKIWEVLKQYSSTTQIFDKTENSTVHRDTWVGLAIGVGSEPHNLYEERIYVTEKLWQIYSKFIRVHGRLGFLVSQGIEKKEPVNWKNDTFMQDMVVDILPEGAWEAIQNMKLSGLRGLINLLEHQFIVEASISMRGTDQLAETVTEYRRIIEQAEAEAEAERIHYRLT